MKKMNMNELRKLSRFEKECLIWSVWAEKFRVSNKETRMLAGFLRRDLKQCSIYCINAKLYRMFDEKMFSFQKGESA